MDIKEYIASGIIADYVFGSVSKQEHQEVECMSKIYPEIKAEITLIQEAIENMAINAKEKPSPELKQRVMKAIRATQQVKPNQNIIPLKTTPKKGSTKFYAAASILVLIALGTYTFFLRQDFNKIEFQNKLFVSKNDSLNRQLNQLQLENNYSNELISQLDNSLQFVTNVNTSRIQLSGTANYPDNQAEVYWNQSTSQTLFISKNLPELSINESYQLWVLIDGEPRDMGIIENNEAGDVSMMKTTNKANAFAVTIEPKGGSVVPTLEKLCLIGNV
ncbi:anti-sigma factor [Crocinitomix algicola]|uniref:anti-sigma factor n=1 Tax=Crocinitomix algicola TaxID=1740263 RepID=UPI0008304987|nr:anti-sigma factor [Crocinitomix algicola]